jgi:hypothetical protein
MHYVAPEIYIYSVMIAICLIAAVQVYRHFQHGRRRLMTVILVCCLLASWQIVDIGILRLPNAWQVWDVYGGYFTFTYTPRFETNRCQIILETYYGNRNIAIVTHIERAATWMACGA